MFRPAAPNPKIPATMIEVEQGELDSLLTELVRDVLRHAGKQAEPPLTFDLCIDGQRYGVWIVPATSQADGRCLSPREQEIVRLIAKGLSAKAIAFHLGLRTSTVSTYTRRIYLKLNVSSRAEMVAKVFSDHSRRILL